MPVALCAVFMYVRFYQKPLRVQRYNNFLIYANLFAFRDGIFCSQAGWGLAACVFYRPCMVDTIGEKTQAGCFGEKTRAVCSSMGGLQSGDDEAAESGTVVFRHTYVIFDCRLTVG